MRYKNYPYQTKPKTWKEDHEQKLIRRAGRQQRAEDAQKFFQRFAAVVLAVSAVVLLILSATETLHPFLETTTAIETVVRDMPIPMFWPLAIAIIGCCFFDYHGQFLFYIAGIMLILVLGGGIIPLSYLFCVVGAGLVMMLFKQWVRGLELIGTSALLLTGLSL